MVRLVGSDRVLHTTVFNGWAEALHGQFTMASVNYVFESLDQHGWLVEKRKLYPDPVEFKAAKIGALRDRTDAQFAPKFKP